MKTDIAVLGGGASGLAAAIAAKEANMAADVTVIEKLPRIGKKIIATMAGIAAAIGPVITILGKLMSVFGAGVPIVGGLITAFTLLYKNFAPFRKVVDENIIAPFQKMGKARSSVLDRQRKSGRRSLSAQ